VTDAAAQPPDSGEATPARTAVVVPGARNGPRAPLLMFSADAAEARGARIRPISWTRPDDPIHLAAGEREPWVLSQVDPVLDELDDDGALLLIGKSLGSHAAAAAARRTLPAVWLTPMLSDDSLVAALHRATAPCLLVGGTADPLWNGPLARQLSPHVLEVEGADHGMYVPGPLAGSAAVLGRVATAVEEFLDGVLWLPADEHDAGAGAHVAVGRPGRRPPIIG
jgi:hypothetical protein